MAEKLTFYVSSPESAQNDAAGDGICKSYPTLESAREAARLAAADGAEVEVVLREGA